MAVLQKRTPVYPAIKPSDSSDQALVGSSEALAGYRCRFRRSTNAITPVAIRSTEMGSANSGRVSYTAFIGGSAGTENEALWKAHSPT